MKTPRSSWTQPHVVKSAMMTPWPPTLTTSSLRIAARPHIALKNPPTNSMIPANVAHPVGRYSSRGTDVLEGVGVVVAMSVLSPISSPDAGPGEGDRASPAGGDAPSAAAGEHRHVQRLTWVGHATVLVEMDGARLLTDPVLRSRLLHLRRYAAAPAPEVSRGLDAVLLSHLHADHLDPPSLRSLDRDAMLVGPRGAGRVLRRLGFATTIELAPGETVPVGAVTVTAVPAVHNGRRWPGGHTAEPVGFVISGERRVYFAGDTDIFDEMRELAAPELDVALLPVWGWGPSLGSGHMDPAAAARAAALLRPRVAVPIHGGTLSPVGLARRHGELLVAPPRTFARHVAELAPDVRVEILPPGASLDLTVRVAG